MKKKLNVAVFNTQPPHLYFGGVERRIVETAKKLLNKVDTRVYSGTKAGFRKISLANGTIFIPCFSTDILFPLDNWFFNKTISRMSDAFKADVYEAHTVSGYGFLKATRKRSATKPFIQTIHGVLADEYIQSSKSIFSTPRTKLSHFFMRYLSKIEKESAKDATLIVTVSKYSSKKIVQLYNVDETKIRIVPNGVDLQNFKPVEGCEKVKHKIEANNKQCVLFVGRLVPRKGLHFLIEAAKHVVKERKETKFVVVGDGPLKKHLISYSKKQGVSDNFVFLGEVHEVLLPRIYNCADVFALPSIQEGQGIALLEAQATAKPVVAFNVSGINEIVLDKETGLLVKPDSYELANSILDLLSNRSLREKMGRCGRKFVSENFTWDICAQRMLQVYCEASQYARST
ncbi:MAG: glycosyltransferase family 4 protein [Candidatus Bathyarchaeota archaeon]|nr:glycosyltransferase family 4 protein [Candidatus Bathyarchaeota archaeon]MDH5595149.1 glycosyltransferase family 4 protein [Candidatus Bathyarchaeota archaeon]